MYIQCIYKVRKTREKTNRCQNVNVEKKFNILLKIEINLINCDYPKRLININHKREIK